MGTVKRIVDLIKVSIGMKKNGNTGSSHSVGFLLSNETEKTISKSGIDVRKAISPLLRKKYAETSKYQLVIDHREELPKTEKGKIFIVNHRQADDIVLGVNVIDEPGYILFGNPTLVLETTDGLGLWAHGIILVDRNDELSRKSSYEKMKYVLEHGGNVFIYVEGYWNLDDDGLQCGNVPSDDHNSDSWLMQDFNVGFVRLAKETGSLIVPTILHYDEINTKRCYGRRLKHFSVDKDDNIFEKKDIIKEYMQTEYYDLMMKYSPNSMMIDDEEYKFYSRKELETCGKSLKRQYEELKEHLRSACDIERIDYKLDLEKEKAVGKVKYVPKQIVTNEEAFSYLPKSAFTSKGYVKGLRKKSY